MEGHAVILTEELFLAGMRLKSAPRLAGDVAKRLSEIESTEAYSRWAGSAQQAAPFRIEDPLHTNALEAIGLVVDGRLRVRVNRMHDRLFVTDGVWVDPRWRVFPFCDESETLLAHASPNIGWPDWTLDLAAGCGHNMLGFDGADRRIGFDVNPRALAYAVINRSLNGIDAKRQGFGLNDICDGIPACIGNGLDGRVLILANMPFGLAPDRDALPLTSNGGPSGASLQIATFLAVRDLAAAKPTLDIRACLMGLTVGDHRTDRWEIVEKARECFGADRVTWTLLKGEKVFRVNGIRELDNPVPLRGALPRITECTLYVKDAERSEQRAAYERLALQHEEMGNPDISYGIVDVRLNR
ncbi:hypothetical protein TSA1_08320 [Bradyrhizobium nitroreducens]|uniref:Methyltransferase n=1 Tax=Bradyrhizobium nitroreducens TaxID=709803 RepID=A0A2M6U845_9BRAD|nr:hypothetical protein [Bradyrhizobium nitroreducens]PIT00776.1 hypothetical protein TSA1_08320 [Bradyrhizobium nitroreducens]